MRTIVKILRRGKTLVWTAFSIIVIFCAVIVGLGKLFMPYSAQYQGKLEAWLSNEFGQPVEIDSFSGDWKAFGPQLELKGMKLLAADGTAGISVIDEAVIDVKPFNILFPSRALYNFRVVGANFHLVRLEDGSFEFSGLGVGGGEGGGEAGLKKLASINEVLLENSSLMIDDEIHQIHLDLHAINGRLQARGNQLSVEISTSLTHRTTGTVFGELEATAKIMLDSESHPVSALWQLSGQEMMLDELRERLPPSEYFPHQGRFNTDLWGQWNREDHHRVRGVADLRDAHLVNETFDRRIERLNTRFILEFAGSDDWRIDLAEFVLDDGTEAVTVNSLALGRNIQAEVGLWVSADSVPIRIPAEIARDVVSIAGKDWPRYIPSRGDGTVRNFEMVLNSRMRLGTATGMFRRASVSDWDIWPDISNVDGRLEFGPGFGSLILNGKGMLVEWPRMFTAPLTADLPSCRVNFGWTPGVKGQYQVGIEQCVLENEFVSASGDMNFRGNTGKPAVDVLVYVDRLDIGAVSDYWPRDLLKPTVTDWLSAGLKAGELDSGQLQIFGDMDDWPFDNGEGRFETLARVSNADIAYFEGWPEAKGVDGVARFINSGMDVTASVASIGGVQARSIHAGIGDFRRPELRVEYQSDTDLPGILGFIQQTPIRENIGIDLDRFEFKGQASTSGTLKVPLSEGSTGIILDGSVELSENTFSAPEYEFSLTGIGGTVSYNQSGFTGEELVTEYQDKPARLAVQAGQEPAPPQPQPADEPGGQMVPGPTAGFIARLDGMFAIQDLLPAKVLESWSTLSRIEGASHWNAQFVAGDETGTIIELTTDFAGTSLALPAPLNKSADESWPFELVLPLSAGPKTMELSLADRISAEFDMDEAWSVPQRGAITLGGGKVELPPVGQLKIGGNTTTLNLDEWIDLVIEEAQEGQNLGGLQLESGVLSSEEMIFIDRKFDAVDMSFSAGDELLNVAFEAADINGSVSFVRMGDTGHSLSAEFERLVLDAPVTEGMQMDVDPAGLPALHLYAQSLKYAGVEFGRTRIEAYPTSEGFHFEKVEAESENMNLQASGDWSLGPAGHRSSFDIHMASESLGDFLRHLGIATPVEGGQTLVRFEVWWDGSPGQFKLARLNGDVNFTVNTGVIRDASPGTGRLLGLLSVQALPRRLALDFRDVFDSGFAFDEANGTFRMLNGSAQTDDVLLKSSAANISFSGTTDLVAQEYDQLITVRPGLGNTLPIIGAIAGGPGGAAAGLALQGLLHAELGEASQVQYTLRGDWAEPEIEPVLKSDSDG